MNYLINFYLVTKPGEEAVSNVYVKRAKYNWMTPVALPNRQPTIHPSNSTPLSTSSSELLFLGWLFSWSYTTAPVLQLKHSVLRIKIIHSAAL